MTEVNKELSEDGTELTIRIDGRFDFSCHQIFRDAYERVSSRPGSYIIDLQKTTYMDSSALGMLLLLRDHAGGDKAQVVLRNVNPDTRKILAISNFDKLFSIF